jgi:hypothetical protein
MRMKIERRLRRRPILAAGLIGLAVAGSFAVTSMLPAALADDEPWRTVLSTEEELLPDDPLPAFFKPRWTIEPSVNTDVVKQQTVRKIGYGRTEFVDIVTTPTGTYSSDALASPYVRYPGIHDTETEAGGVFAIWDGSEWTSLDAGGARSFAVIIAIGAKPASLAL